MTKAIISKLVLSLILFAFALSRPTLCSAFEPPGTAEAAAVDRANTEIDAVYKQLMSKLDPEGQKSLKDAQRSWIKWRDDEALLIARVGGAIGGSGLRVDVLTAQTKLIRQRTEVLKGYLTASGSD